MRKTSEGRSYAVDRDTIIPTRFRFVVVGLLFMIATVNYVDRGALSFASEHIIGAFGFDSAQWGEILGFFGYGYMFGARTVTSNSSTCGRANSSTRQQDKVVF